MQLRIVDAIGPFFAGYDNPNVINWSKVPFDNFDVDGKPSPERLKEITKEFKAYIDVVCSRGFTAILLDDLAHLVTHDIYSKELNAKISVYAQYYKEMIAYAKKQDLKVFVTTDLLFFNDEIRQHVKSQHARAATFLQVCTRKLFDAYPVDGLLVRIGESDGVDVHGDFKSELVIKTPKDAQLYTNALLDVCEEYQKLLIMRTWTVGAHPIGDLLWNPKTFKEAFGGIRSKQFILSIKHGESDFFRYLPLNPLFSATSHKKIIEFQARREYEGFGAYPSFIGKDVHEQLLQLPKSVIGATVLAQTGGWSKIRRRTYLDEDGVWNALNADVASQLIQGKSLKEAIEFAHTGLSGSSKQLEELLFLSDELVKNVLYIRDFASKDVFFRRARVPPLLWIFWDVVIVSDEMRSIITQFVKRDQPTDLSVFTKMKRLSTALGLPMQDIDFMRDTFTLIARARAILIEDKEDKTFERALKKYYATYPHHYTFDVQTSTGALSGKLLSLSFRALNRNTRKYRLVDRALSHPTRLLGPLLMRWHRKHLPEFAKSNGMGESIFFR